VYKESKIHVSLKTLGVTDSGFVGIVKLQSNSLLPVKKTKKRPLSKQDKYYNRVVAKLRAANEHIFSRIKRFRILSERYRNRRKRFGLRFNLVAGICNFELLS
jgi:transposase